MRHFKNTEKIIDNILLYIQNISSSKSNASLTGNIGYTYKNNDNKNFQLTILLRKNNFLLYGENEGLKIKLPNS